MSAADFGLSGKVEHQRISVPHLSIGDSDFHWVKTNLIGIDDDEDENWIVGSALLNQYVTVIDYHTSKLHVLPYEDSQFRSRYNLIGLELRKLRTGEFIVRYVFPDSASANLDIEVGDLIQSIDGKPTRDISMDDWLGISAIPGRHQVCRLRTTEMCVDVTAEHIVGYSIPNQIAAQTLD